MKCLAFRSFITRLTGIVLAIFMLACQSAFASDLPGDDRNIRYLQGIMDMIREEYSGTPTDEQLIQSSIKGMLGSLDPYTAFYTPKEADSFMTSVSGTFGGVGIVLEAGGDYIVAVKVLPGSPAEKAGIIQGDRIVEADGKSLIKVTPDDAANIIKGNVGTKVKLGILRNGSSTVKYFEMIREIIKVNPVTYEIRNGIGYIKLETFNENADEYITKALNEMDRKGVSKIVLDLRDNPGGEVGQAVLLAQKFVPKGPITKLDYKYEKYPDIEYNSNLEKTKYRLAVLVNGMSASASEIVAGAVQDTGAGKLVGTKTFGKAKFQGIMPILTPEAFEKYSRQIGKSIVNAFDLQNFYNIYPSKDEIAGYTKITLGLYYTPKGRMIDGKGLTPDVVVADPKPVNGIQVNSIQKLTGTTDISPNGQGVDVLNAEKILKVLGYKAGDVDTTLDSGTADALKAYQKANKLAAGGTLDMKTRSSLNNELLKLLEKYDTQYAAAVKTLQ